LRTPTRYSDVLGQNTAVEAARDLIELPLKHADLFLRTGVASAFVAVFVGRLVLPILDIFAVDSQDPK